MRQKNYFSVAIIMLLYPTSRLFSQGTGQPITINDVVQPADIIGPDDLLAIVVFDSPSMSRKIRVTKEGNIQLALLSSPVHASGLLPDTLAARIADALRADEILVSPSVSVAVLQYSSRPVSVVGEVKHPITFDVSGHVTLVTAITRAEGLTPEAGSLITVMARNGVAPGRATTVISVKQLMDGRHPELNLALTGGEEILVARAPKVFVIGNVRRPGSYFVQDDSDLSVLKIIALAEGPLPFTAPEAYITRTQQDGERIQILIDLRGMIKKTVPDMPMQGSDLLYVRDSKGKRLTMTALDRIAGFGSATASGLVVFH